MLSKDKGLKRKEEKKANTDLKYLSVWQEKQVRTGLSINIIAPGEICQVINMASFL
jgi:hypothetical protein